MFNLKVHRFVLEACMYRNFEDGLVREWSRYVVTKDHTHLDGLYTCLLLSLVTFCVY